jgi:hypothetical protein
MCAENCRKDRDTKRERERERERESTALALHSDAVRSPRCELVTTSLLLRLMRVHIAFFPPTHHPSCSLQSRKCGDYLGTFTLLASSWPIFNFLSFISLL